VIAENEERARPNGGPASLRVDVGETVVYAAHGVGRVVAFEQKHVDGIARECVVVELAAGLRVTLPLSDAAERLRMVADERELAEVQKTLASSATEREGPWTKRIKESKEKLAAGKATGLAEIIRDGARFEGGSNGVQLSQAERSVYVQARGLLVRELCSARGMQEAEAEAWIDAQIASSHGNEH
jgi:CarD family transcriptional regulator